MQWAISSNYVVLHQEGASQRPSPCANTVHFTADCSSTGRHAATSQQPRRPPCKTTAVMDGIVGAEHIASAQAQRWNQGTAQEGHDAAASANPQPRAKADDGLSRGDGRYGAVTPPRVTIGGRGQLWHRSLHGKAGNCFHVWGWPDFLIGIRATGTQLRSRSRFVARAAQWRCEC